MNCTCLAMYDAAANNMLDKIHGAAFLLGLLFDDELPADEDLLEREESLEESLFLCLLCLCVLAGAAGLECEKRHCSPFLQVPEA